ncbi:MAG: F0F1 ATP synthase subunit gamma [Propionibacteriaceae bacterium]|nr:F0F1 ATP synthase subunit gamma [Propionibacteriaceae bacterium]
MAGLRELKQRRNSVATTKKITRAMELIAASRIVKAQSRTRAAEPYTWELERAVSMLASHCDVEHPLTRHAEHPVRSAILLITGDRGLAGAYSSNVIKAAEQLHARLAEDGQEVVQYIAGRKGITYFEFRKRPIEQSWQGFSDAPTYEHARDIADVLLAKFGQPTEEGGVDQIYIVGTRFESMLTQTPRVIRMLPLEIVEAENGDEPIEDDPYFMADYRFEPDAQTVLNALLPLYVANRVYFALLTSGASELASRQKAMKSATDNAQSLIETLTRDINQARQASITQEITEIVGGASALAESASE